MISTRLHGAIDYAAAALAGTLAATGTLSPPVKRVLGSASLLHTSYAALTDYEAGLQGRLTMRQHLALDALGGTALCLAGLALRRRRGGRMLAALGLAELGVVAFSSATPHRGPGQGAGPVARLLHAVPEHAAAAASAYPPLDTPKPVAEDVWIVDSVLAGLLGSVLPVRMTVVRLPGGDLLLHSPTRFSLALASELMALGPIRHLVAPNIAHWVFLQDWQRYLPAAVTWAAPNLRRRRQVRRSGLRLDHDLPGMAPEAWGGAITLVDVPGGLGLHEIALFHQSTRTLMLADLVLNLEAQKVPAAVRPIVRLFGSLAPDGMPPPYLRAIFRSQGAAARNAAQALVALQPERVVFAHGRWFEQDGTASLRRSLRWLLE